MVLSLSDLVGFIGVGMLIGAYAALQLGRLPADNPWYSALNAAAAVLIFISLLYKPNPPSMVIEIFWFAISVYGLVKSLRARRASKAGHQAGTPPSPKSPEE